MGVSPTSENYKAMDTIYFYKRDLDRRLLDIFALTNVQSVDVYNSYDAASGVDRNQPYDSGLLNRVVQGNTVISDFSFKVMSTSSDYAMIIRNARTLDGDWINRNGSDGEPGGRWWVHGGTGNQTSDGCFIPSNAMLEALNAKMREWGVRPGHEIAGRMQDERGRMIRLMGADRMRYNTRNLFVLI
jgi:hypothetical protein